MSEFYHVSLPKWAASVIWGEPVTPNQAKEILIRTDSWSFFSNDKAFQSRIWEIATGEESPTFTAQEAARERHRVLQLEYMTNDQVMSAYILGPHGWCDWKGRIYCDDHNVGKWPSVLEVEREWQLIASAFPYLRLTHQLYNGEHTEEGIYPVIQFDVSNGNVTMGLPDVTEIKPVGLTEDRVLSAFGAKKERGCTFEQFREALVFARDSSPLGQTLNGLGLSAE